jgi:hypothetical protein
LAWRLASVKERNTDDAGEVQTADEDGDAEWQLHNREECSERSTCICGTDA